MPFLYHKLQFSPSNTRFIMLRVYPLYSGLSGPSAGDEASSGLVLVVPRARCTRNGPPHGPCWPLRVSIARWASSTLLKSTNR